MAAAFAIAYVAAWFGLIWFGTWAIVLTPRTTLARVLLGMAAWAVAFKMIAR